MPTIGRCKQYLILRLLLISINFNVFLQALSRIVSGSANTLSAYNKFSFLMMHKFFKCFMPILGRSGAPPEG